jgi:rhamnose utilization protein RhaD (predicted bifunctional aldolase and dehydrogenase)
MGIQIMLENQALSELIDRSNRLGSDKRNTNFAGGNTSAKGIDIDPVSGGQVELIWVKGSGGDLGTLTLAGISALRLDRLRQLVDVYPGIEHENEMVAAFDYCLHGKGGAAPSIDTAMHGLIEMPHVDHLHPDSGIAFATSADGERLTRECFGTDVVGPLASTRFSTRTRYCANSKGSPASNWLHTWGTRRHCLGKYQ